MITYEVSYVQTTNGWFTDLRDNVRDTMSRIPGRWPIADAVPMQGRSRQLQVWPGAYE